MKKFWKVFLRILLVDIFPLILGMSIAFIPKLYIPNYTITINMTILVYCVIGIIWGGTVVGIASFQEFERRRKKELLSIYEGVNSINEST